MFLANFKQKASFFSTIRRISETNIKENALRVSIFYLMRGEIVALANSTEIVDSARNFLSHFQKIGMQRSQQIMNNRRIIL